MGQRILYGVLAIVVILALVLLDVMIAQALLEPPMGETASQVGPAADGLSDFATTGLGRLLSRGSVLPLTILGLMLAAACEMANLLRRKGAKPHVRFAMLMIAVLCLSPWLSAAEWLGRGAAQLEGLYWQVVWLMIGLVGAGLLSVVRREPSGLLRDLGATWLMILYLGFLPSFAVQLRCGLDRPGYGGAWLLLITVLVTKAADIGGYLVGSTMGRHKLAPKLSPGKSIEGALGGLLLSAGVAVAFASLAMLPAQRGGGETASLNAANLALLHEVGAGFGRAADSAILGPLARAAVFGLIISVFAQMGDLLESGFKRDADVKNSGHLLPGFGGILDLVDSPLLTFPVAWFLMTAIWGFV